MLYANTLPFLYKELECLQILVSVEGPGTNFPGVPRDNCTITISINYLCL